MGRYSSWDSVKLSSYAETIQLPTTVSQNQLYKQKGSQIVYTNLYGEVLKIVYPLVFMNKIMCVDFMSGCM